MAVLTADPADQAAQAAVNTQSGQHDEMEAEVVLPSTEFELTETAQAAIEQVLKSSEAVEASLDAELSSLYARLEGVKDVFTTRIHAARLEMKVC